MAVRNLNRTSPKPKQPADRPKDIKYYYDYHPTKEDLMAESPVQFDLILYLVSLLRWLYRDQSSYIVGNLNIYQTRSSIEHPIAPDVAFFKGLTIPQPEQDKLRSWQMWQANRPAPTVAFEIASDDTWREDLLLKPEQYHDMGVKEYFAYDPHQPGIWRINRKPTPLRLRGWRYQGDEMLEIVPNEQGWLWSKQLDKFLVPNTRLLQLYTADKQLCLTQEAAMTALLTKLRARGIDPDEL